LPDYGFGFWPTLPDWRAGAIHFLYFIAIAFPLNLLLHATHTVPMRPPLAIAGYFFGALWVAPALSEEYFFRGVLQGWLETWTHNRTAGLAVASLAFGSIHYFFRGWNWVILTFILGWICGHARNQTGGIRAGVVTHSLVVATWRAFFW